MSYSEDGGHAALATETKDNNLFCQRGNSSLDSNDVSE